MSIEPIALGEIAPEATLEDCEQALRQSERNHAIEQGIILRHIRDNRLYKDAGFTSFDDWCENRYGYTRQWAHQRIDLAETAAQLSTIVDSPQITSKDHARAIKPVLRDHGPEVAAEVLREAADDDGRLTARSISDAATRLHVVEDEPEEVLTQEQWQERNQQPEDDWTAEEHALADRLDAGETIVVNMHDDAHARLWQYAEQERKAVRIDRRSIWGNPFVIGDDGDRDTVCDAYETVYFPHKPRLIAEVSDLKGQALGCWCAPARCHGDFLARQAQR